MHTRQAIRKSSSLFRLQELPAVCSRICSNSLGAEYDKPTTDFEKKFFDHIHDFAFYNDLNAACLDNTGKNINALLSEHNYKAVVSNLLESAGLNYGALPKGLLKFHRYADGVRTPLEEHLVEAHCMLPERLGK